MERVLDKPIVPELLRDILPTLFGTTAVINVFTEAGYWCLC